AEQRGRSRGGHAVLAGPGLRDQPRLAHPPGQQRLAEHVVDLVRPGVGEVLALEQHRAAARLLAEPLGPVQQRRPGGVAAQQRVEVGPEDRVPARLLVGGRQFVQRRYQRLGREPAAVGDTGRLAGPALLGDPDRADHEVARGVGNRGNIRLGGRGVLPGRRDRLGHPRSPRSAGCDPAVTRSATAHRGSLPVTRLSPTSTASAPEAAYASRSRGPRTPDSATLTIPSGIRPAIRPKIPRSTFSVARLRALTPMTVAPASSARSSSGSVCTSTSGSMPIETVRSTSETSALCSSAATISSTTSAPCARASHSWYELTTKSLRSTGTWTARRTASRSSR